MTQWPVRHHVLSSTTLNILGLRYKTYLGQEKIHKMAKNMGHATNYTPVLVEITCQIDSLSLFTWCWNVAVRICVTRALPRSGGEVMRGDRFTLIVFSEVEVRGLCAGHSSSFCAHGHCCHAGTWSVWTVCSCPLLFYRNKPETLPPGWHICSQGLYNKNTFSF